MSIVQKYVEEKKVPLAENIFEFFLIFIEKKFENLLNILPIILSQKLNYISDKYIILLYRTIF